jgi:glucose-6-phosphate isomerase
MTAASFGLYNGQLYSYRTHMTRPQDTTAWQTLTALADAQESAASTGRPTPPSIVSTCGISLDLSRQSLPAAGLALFAQLAAEIKLAEKSAALVAGQAMNITEQRPVLHALLRQSPNSDK